MLYLDKPIGPIHGFTVYRDNEDASYYYYIRERPRLAINDGVAEFLFLKYRRDLTDNPTLDPSIKQSLGGGFLSFTVDLGADEQELAALKRGLAEFADGDINLVPVQFRKGTARLSITKDAADAPGSQPNQPKGINFFEEIYGTVTPSLFGFNRANFSLILDAEGATLMEAALRAGLSPIGTIYELEYLGLRPAFNIKVTADYKRIYDSLDINFGLKGTIYYVTLSVDIDLAFQKLREEGAIKVEVLEFTDDENLRKQSDDAFEWIKKDLLKDFFTPALQPPNFMKQLPSSGTPGLAGGGTPGRTGGTVPVPPGGTGTTPGSTTPGGTGTTPATTSAGAVNQLQNLFHGLNANQPAKSLTPTRSNPTTQSATPANKPSTVGNVPGAGATNQGVSRSLNPGAAQGTAGKPQQFGLELGFTLKKLEQDELRTRTIEYSEQAAVARTAAPQGLFSTIVQGLDLNTAILEVSLDDDYFKQVNTTFSISDDFAATGLNIVGVNVEYPGTPLPGEQPESSDGFVFSPTDLASKTFAAWTNARKDISYRYQVDMHFKADSPWIGTESHVSSDWIVSRARRLILDPLDAVFLKDVEIAIGNFSSGQVTQAQVDVLYQDTSLNFKEEKTFLLKPGDPSAHWKLRLTRTETETYQYRITYLFPDAPSYQTNWITSDSDTIVVNDPFHGRLNIRLVPLLDPSTLIEADVDLTYHENDTGYTRHVLQTFQPADLKTAVISIPTLAQTPAPYSYTFTIVRVDGSSFTSKQKTSTSSIMIISSGEGTPHLIQVKLPTKDISSLAAIKVDLTGSGANPDTASVVFTPSQIADRTAELVQAQSGPFSYSYHITGYDFHGQPLPGANGTSSSSVLIIKIPSA